jgi:hypothetical protein
MLDLVYGVTAVRGDTLRLRFFVTDEEGEPANITGTQPRFALSEPREPFPVIETPFSATASIVDAEGGVFDVVIGPDETQPLDGVYVGQARLDDISGNRQTVARVSVHFLDPQIAPDGTTA